MRTEFVRRTLDTLLREGVARRTDSILAVCAGEAERSMFSELGFSSVVLSNISGAGPAPAPYVSSAQNAEHLAFPDGCFDFGFVCDGLHHCSSPHRALTELFRVARRGIVVCETRDSAVQRLAMRMGLSPQFEVAAVAGNHGSAGGVNNTEIPNFIYRWTERELRKTLSAFHPIGPVQFRFFYGLELPEEHARLTGSKLRYGAVRASALAMTLIAALFRNQNNLLAMVALKPAIPGQLYPWLRFQEGRVAFNRDFALEHFR